MKVPYWLSGDGRPIRSAPIRCSGVRLVGLVGAKFGRASRQVARVAKGS